MTTETWQEDMVAAVGRLRAACTARLAAGAAHAAASKTESETRQYDTAQALYKARRDEEYARFEVMRLAYGDNASQA